MKFSEVVSELKSNGLRVFTVSDIIRITGKRRGYAYLMLSKSHAVMRAQNGLYYLPDTNPFEVACNVAYPSYISLISAFSYYGLIDQLPKVIKVISTKRHRSLEGIQGLAVQFKHAKKEMMYGYKRSNNIAMAYVEKAIVDAYYYNEDTRYLDEVLAGATARGMIDKELLAKYAKMSKSKTIIKKVNALAMKVSEGERDDR
ncbi:MAG: hypothetical protein KGH61_04015 [Candidatus Micrarchaeota archaeon]|nr:hypothetical protein [Candidatus Micrarchaeota archaeon]MDE1848086.1 hypothetical protein [Candidatus Micrarchaeota archaeon]MDE1864937.1 hypothetical protein [Candidatus Micrarchaeota archaeon]